MPPRARKYRREESGSYALGGYAVLELLRCCPENTLAVWLHSEFQENGAPFETLCREWNVPVLHDDRAFSLLSPKENVYVMAQFLKPEGRINPAKPHLVLVHPGDMGNLGTILREAAGFGIPDVAILSGGADEWHPKVVRASMGACFRVRTERFASLADYLEQAGKRQYFCFRLDGEEPLDQLSFSQELPVSLIFGNEASGLPPEYRSLGRGVAIRHSDAIDSLNLSVAVGIGLYAFRQKWRD